MRKSYRKEELKERLARIEANEERRAEERAKRRGATVAVNPALAELPDHDLVNELRRRGYDVKCSKTIEL